MPMLPPRLRACLRAATWLGAAALVLVPLAGPARADQAADLRKVLEHIEKQDAQIESQQKEIEALRRSVESLTTELEKTNGRTPTASSPKPKRSEAATVAAPAPVEGTPVAESAEPPA